MEPTSAQKTRKALSAFVESYLQQEGLQLLAPFDADSRSSCECGEPDARGNIPWRPVWRGARGGEFAGLENALEAPVHADLKAYYSCYWSGHLDGLYKGMRASLLLLWNESDFARLVENFIGHALLKRRRKADLTFFFACVEPDCEKFLSINNSSGEVFVEDPSAGTVHKLADNLTAFLSDLKPFPGST